MSRSTHINRSLFLCYTPFHLSSVLKFFEQSNIKDKKNYVLYVGSKNLQTQKYLQLLSKFSEVNSVLSSKSRIVTILRIFRSQTFLRELEFVNFYCGNYKLIYTRFVLLQLNHNITMLRFDDGVGDLLPGSYFSVRENIFLGLFLLIIRPSLLYHKLNSLPRAFSFYPELVGEGGQKLLFHKKNSFLNPEFTEPVSELNILIGQSYSTTNKNLVSVSQEIELYRLAIEKFSIDILIPHPLSKLNHDSLGVTVVNPEVICEDYITSFLIQGCKCKVVGFRTTALINLNMFLVDFIINKELILKNINPCINGILFGHGVSNDIFNQLDSSLIEIN